MTPSNPKARSRPADRDLIRALLRHDLAAFTQRTFQTVAPGVLYLHNWHLEVITWYLERCLAGRMTRLIVTLPPRSLKSICASVAFPAWALGREPARRIICVSYASELAAKHSRDCRAVIDSPWYRATFPKTRLDPRKNTELEFDTTAGGFRLATSVGGTLTGRGGDILIIDDPLKAADALSDSVRERANDWVRNTLYSRLDDKRRGVIIVVTQRLHVDDLVGQLLGTGDGWVQLNLPAIADAPERFDLGDGRVYIRAPGKALHPDRESLETLTRIKREMGSYDFSAQYQQNPLPLEGGLIKWSWLRSYDIAPARVDGDFVTQSWDTAAKAGELNDWSVCTTWLRRGEAHYLLDVMRVRAEYPQLKRLVLDLKERHGADAVLIEDQGSGTPLIQDLRHDGRVHPIAIKPEGDKAMRMFATTALLEAGTVSIPRAAPWLEDFRAELLQFPRGRHDDQIDSLSQYLNWAKTHGSWNDGDFYVVEGKVAREWDTEVGLAYRSPPPWLIR
jgi:predicted phage terminase large subunit-like protein